MAHVFISEEEYAELLRTKEAFAFSENYAQTLKAQIDKLPELILQAVTDNYGEPCDQGLAEFMDEAELEMPIRKKTVRISWSESMTATYEDEDEVDCEWDGTQYVPCESSLDRLRDQATDNGPRYDYHDTFDYEEEILD